MIDRMEVSRPKRRTSYLALLLLTVAMSAFTLSILLGLRDSSQLYSDAQSELSKPIYSGELVKVQFPDSEKPLVVATFERFKTGELWSLVSRDHQLPDDFTPQNLVDLTVPHGDKSTPMKVQQTMTDQLQLLLAAAEADDEPLMISSAYRSIDDQRELYESFVDRMGEEMAREYVALPRSSEHHTGLAVDFSNRSDACATDSDSCALGIAAAAWLEENAYRFGFIQRYPEGKKPITGIGHEPWHYRYVGVVLASRIQASDLTLDEALMQIRPALVRSTSEDED